MSIYCCNVCQTNKDSDYVDLTICYVCGEDICDNCISEDEDMCCNCFNALNKEVL
jgi:hypothetical protein